MKRLRMKFKTVVGVVIVFSVFIFASVSAGDNELLTQAKKYFKPLPKGIPAPSSNPTTPQKVQLGKKLYYDPRLSLSGVISCNTCHNLATYGSDNV